MYKIIVSFVFLLSATAFASGGVPPVIDPCIFREQLPKDLYVYAAGAYAGKDLPFETAEGDTVTEIVINVHEPAKPVALILGAYDPVIWQIRWSKGTKIVAVYISGYEPQRLSGLPPDIPVIISGGGSCGRHYVSELTLDWINPLSRKLFGKNADMVYVTGRDGFIDVGKPGRNIEFFNEYAKSSSSYIPAGTPPPGSAGIRRAIDQRVIRRATQADYDALVKIVNQSKGDKSSLEYFLVDETYVIMKPFVIPPNMHEVMRNTFILLKGVPYPKGNGQYVVIFDMNQGGQCFGAHIGCDEEDDY